MEVETPLGQWEAKCWGLTRCVGRNPFCSAHELIVVAGWQCSLHRHRARANGFYLDTGIVEVIRYCPETFAAYRRDVLNPGDSIEVPSGVWHRFRVVKGGHLFEHYWSDRGGTVDVNDIERVQSDLGGRWL